YNQVRHALDLEGRKGLSAEDQAFLTLVNAAIQANGGTLPQGRGSGAKAFWERIVQQWKAMSGEEYTNWRAPKQRYDKLQKRVQNLHDGGEATMQTTLADVLMTHIDALAGQLAHVLPWVKHLNSREQVELLADLAQACVQARRTGDHQTLMAALEDWEATALLVSDGSFVDRLQRSQAPHEYIAWEALRADIPSDSAP